MLRKIMNIKKIFWPILLLTGFLSAQITLNVTNGNNDHATSIENTSGEVVMMQLELSASNGDAEVTSISVNPVIGGNLKRGDIVDLEVRIYEDKNNNGILETGIDEFITAGNYGGNSNQAPTNNTISIPNHTILNGTTQNWLIVNTFSNVTSGYSILLQVTGLTLTSGIVTGTTVTGNQRTFRSDANNYTGSLFVGPGGANPIAHNVSASATDVVMLQLVLATSTLEGGTISDISFDMSGNGNDVNVASARLYIDGDANGILNLEQDTQLGTTQSGFGNNDVISFTGVNRAIAAGSAEHWIVVYNFSGASNSFVADLTTNADITVSASQLTVTGAPVNGNTISISDEGSLVLSAGTYNPTARTISATEDELEMIQVNLAANATENIKITSIAFKTTGTANEATDIDSALLVYDANSNGRYDVVYDQIIDSTMSFSDNGLITFSSFTDTIDAGTSKNWLLLYYLGGDTASSGETFKAYIDDITQIAAEGVTSVASIDPLGLPVNGNTMTVSSTGTLTLALAANNPGDVNFSDPVTNLPMLAFTMTANDVEDINLTSITVTPQSVGIVNSQIVAADIKIYEDVDKNGLLNTAVDRYITEDNYNGPTAQVPEAVTIDVTGETIAASSSVQWLIVHSFNGVADNDYMEVTVLNTDISGTGSVSTNAANISGPNLFGGTKTCVPATGSTGALTLGEGASNPVYRFISPGTQNETMLQFQLSADAVEDIDITEVKIVTSGTGNESNDLTSVRLYLDGDDNGTLNPIFDTQLGSTISSLADNDILTFTSFNDTISKGTAKNYIVVYNYNGTNNTVGETFKAVTGNTYITATGISSTSSIVPTGGPANGEIATITDTGTLTVSAGANNPGSTNVSNADNNVTTIQLNVAAGNNEDVTITAFTFRLSGTFDDGTDFETSSFRLYVDDNSNGAYDGGEVQLNGGQTCSADNGFVTFTGFTESILAGTSKDYILLTNLNGNASNFENFRVSFVNSTDIIATGDDTGDDIFPDGVPVQGGLFTVGATGSLSLTTGTNNPATGTENPSAQDVEMLQIRLSASGVENINITAISFVADGTGGDNSDISSVTLYLDVNNDGQYDVGDTQIATGNYAADNGTINFTGLSESITASTNENWLLVYDFNAGATNGETYRVGIYNNSQITSTGATSGNPITETGFPVVSNYKTITTTGTMSIFAGDYNPAIANISSVTEYEMLQIKLSVSTIEDIDVDDLTITHIGTGNPVADIAANGVQLVRDNNNNGVYDSGTDDILASTSYSGTTATFTLAPVTISVDNTENWLVMYTFSSLTVGETFRARVTDLADLSLTGGTSGAPITASGSVPISGGTMTVNNDFGLPVELTSFTATGEHGFIGLEWITESEINNQGFSIERQTSSQDYFEEIASYSSDQKLLGAGNTSAQTVYSFNDSTVIPGQEYTYRLIQYDYSGLVHIQQIMASAIAKEPLPTQFGLAQNYPNPFNPETQIKVALPQQSRIILTIFNILGQEVMQLTNDEYEAGHYNFKWDGTNKQGIQTSSGLYFYTLQVKTAKGSTLVKSRKMIKLQ